MPREPHIEAKNLLTNCGPLFVKRLLGMPKRIIQCSNKTFAIFVDDVFDVRIVCVCLKYLSVMKTTNRITCAVSGRGSRMFMATKPSGSAAENSERCL